MDAILSAATVDDLPRIENLMQFYNHDMSEWYPVPFGDHGMYTLRPKQPYWARPGVKPFIGRVDGQLAGFAVVDDEVTDPASQFNMGYFFVARRYRSLGLGRRWVADVLNRFPGRWEIVHYAGNQPAARFWPKAIAGAGASGRVSRHSVLDDMPSITYQFDIGAR